MQGGLQLPDREYYLGDSEQMRKIRAQYQTHIATMLKLAGFSNTDERAVRILELEHAIAQTHRSLADNEDIHKAQQHLDSARSFPPTLPASIGRNTFAPPGSVSKALHRLAARSLSRASPRRESASLETWKDWLAFHLIEAYAGVLPKPLAEERFSFFGKELSGTQQQRPRWQRGVFLVDGLLGDVVGQTYAQRYFSPEAKAQAESMVAN
jgi:putative endopeptidase